jgi:hypothetical protein
MVMVVWWSWGVAAGGDGGGGGEEQQLVVMVVEVVRSSSWWWWWCRWWGAARGDGGGGDSDEEQQLVVLVLSSWRSKKQRVWSRLSNYLPVARVEEFSLKMTMSWSIKPGAATTAVKRDKTQDVKLDQRMMLCHRNTAYHVGNWSDFYERMKGGIMKMWRWKDEWNAGTFLNLEKSTDEAERREWGAEGAKSHSPVRWNVKPNLTTVVDRSLFGCGTPASDVISIGIRKKPRGRSAVVKRARGNL